jgi:hypothetical protein
MNIFNWAQDNNIKLIENIDYWLLKNLPLNIYQAIRGSNGLTSKRAERICRNMFNLIGVAPDDRLHRLVGFGESPDDYYYILKDSKGKSLWCSMVGGFTPLVKRIPNRDYHNIEMGFTLNGCPPEESFILQKEPSLYEVVDSYNDDFFNDLGD